MNEKKNILPYDALTKGYILVPKALLIEALNQRESEFTYLEAFLMVLTKVNYKDSIANIRTCNVECKRGESLMSFVKWAGLFHWKRHKTRRFFTKIEQKKLVEIIPTNMSGITRVKVVNYDLWTSKPAENWEHKKTYSEEMFEKFWDEFHETTMTRKREIGAARKEWTKLSEKERKMAVEQIYSYYMGVDDTRYIKRACNYLRDKSFLNDEIY